MPKSYDFSYLEDRDIVQLNIAGWIPLEIEFATTNNATQEQELYWKVVGTDHTFRAFLSFLYENYQDNYEKYFEDILTAFRKDFKEWEREGFKFEGVEIPWMLQYRDQFQKYIK